MSIPTLWHPIPNRTDVWDRVFRTEIENNLDSDPVLTGHIQRAYDIAGEKVFKYCPEMALTTTFDAIQADPELAQFLALPTPQFLHAVFYTLWLRKITPAAPEA